eukprot:3098569-Prorocentrum_lima.AAC.1
MQQTSEYFGLLNKNGPWFFSESARRHSQQYYCILRVPHSTLHLSGCFGARLSAGKRSPPGIACADSSLLWYWPRSDPQAS